MPKKPSPLPKLDPSMFPSAEELKARGEERRKDAEDQLLLRGKYTPEPGTCVVCQGKVVAETKLPRWDGRIGGIRPPSRAYIARWYCEGCGIVYRSPPKKKEDHGKGE